jgi:hypothetical protein
MENIAISIIVGTSSHINIHIYTSGKTYKKLFFLRNWTHSTGTILELNLQKMGCAVIWKGAGRFVTWSFRTRSFRTEVKMYSETFNDIVSPMVYA